MKTDKPTSRYTDIHTNTQTSMQPDIGHPDIKIDNQTRRQRDIKIEEHLDRQKKKQIHSNRKASTQTEIHTSRHPYILPHIQTYKYKHSDIQKSRQIVIKIDTQTEIRHTDIKTDIQIHTYIQIYRHKDRHPD